MNRKSIVALLGLVAASAMVPTPAAARGSFSITIGSGGYGGYGWPYGYGSPYGYDNSGYRQYDSYRHEREHEDLDDEHADEHDDLDQLHHEAHQQGLSRREHRRLHRYLRSEHVQEHDELNREHEDEHLYERGYYRGW